jgi:hypothetical protein
VLFKYSSTNVCPEWRFGTGRFKYTRHSTTQIALEWYKTLEAEFTREKIVTSKIVLFLQFIHIVLFFFNGCFPESQNSSIFYGCFPESQNSTIFYGCFLKFQNSTFFNGYFLGSQNNTIFFMGSPFVDYFFTISLLSTVRVVHRVMT